MEQYYHVCFVVLAALIGLCVGSMLNVVIYRLPAGIKLANDRSKCPKCGSMIAWYDNIPLFSYLFLRGKCRHCREPISIRYPVVELVNMLGWLGCALLFTDPFYASACCVAFSVGICIFEIDREHMIIFDRFQVILLCCGIAATLLDTFTPWYSHLIGFAVGGLSFLLISLIFSKILGAEALGFGDVKLAAVMGLFLGWEKLILAILISSLVGSVVLLAVKYRCKYDKQHEYPFAPFLIFGFTASMLGGAPLICAYLNLLGISS